MKNLYRWLIASVLFFPAMAYAQGVTIGSNNPPDPSATLDVQSVSGGFLAPRMTTTQRNAISNPAIGLQVYNTTTECLEIYHATGWNKISCRCTTVLDASFTFSPPQISIQNNITFTPNGQNLNYQWSFAGGNPSSSSSQNPVVQWANGGTYNIILNVSDGNGCSAVDTQTVNVINCPNGSTTYVYTGGLQTFTVPNCVSSITIEAYGAQGGAGQFGGTGGLGAKMSGTFAVVGGTTYTVVVGGQGVSGQNNNSSRGGGGGGGTFVYSQSGNNLLIAAGGGGGGGYSTGNGGPGLTGTTGGNGASGAAGGTNGNGGGKVTSNGYDGGGGAGWLSDGQSNSMASGGKTRTNNWTGGEPFGYSPYGPNGGYGGGGGAEHGAGGGGGYSGGGGGYNGNPFGGGGGGSFSGGTNQQNQQGVRSGHGTVVITY